MILSIPKFCLFPALFILCAIAPPSVKAKEYSPKIVPPNWIDSFDYSSSLQQFLRVQHTLAERSGDRLFVYLYSDWSKDCRQLRKSIQQTRVQKVMTGIRMVMLDFSQIRQWQNQKTRKNHNRKDVLAVWSPVIFAVKADGTFKKEAFYPGKYLDHEYFRDTYRARNQTTSILPRAQPYSEFLSKFEEFLKTY